MESPIRMMLWHGGKGIFAGLLTEGAATAAGNSHAILVAIIAAVAVVFAAVVGPLVTSWWQERRGNDPVSRYLREIERKDKRIAALEAELDEARNRR